MSARRIEITVSEGTWDRLNAARGHEPRASFVKRALESALGSVIPADASGPVAARDRGEGVPNARSSAPSRTSAPTVKPARALLRDPVALERQARLNKAKGS
jgi:hypothetical protein